MGLPGLLMTLADSDRKYINLFGPENSGYLVATMRGFCKRDIMKLQLKELKDEEEGEGKGMGNGNDELKPFFQDENLKISFIELSPFKKEQREKNHHDSSEAVEITSDSRTSSNSNKRRKLTPQTNSKDSSSSSIFEEDLARLNWTSPNFKPTQLSPRDSQIWIKAIVNDMFNTRRRDMIYDSKSNENGKGKGKGKDNGKGKEKEEQEVEIRLDDPDISSLPYHKRSLTPAWVLSTLPHPSTASDTTSNLNSNTSSTSLIYILQAHSQRGKFSPSKALSLGVQPGPSFSNLTKGSNIKIKRPKDEIWLAMNEKERENWSRERNQKEREVENSKKKLVGLKNKKLIDDLEKKLKELKEVLEREEKDFVEVEVRAEEVMGSSRPGFVSIF